MVTGVLTICVCMQISEREKSSGFKRRVVHLQLQILEREESSAFKRGGSWSSVHRVKVTIANFQEKKELVLKEGWFLDKH